MYSVYSLLIVLISFALLFGISAYKNKSTGIKQIY